MTENTLNEVAEKISNMNEILENAKNDAAEAVAKECVGRLNLTTAQAQKNAEMKDADLALAGIVLEPLSADPYIDALLTSSCWRALRSELPGAVVRINNVAVDRATLSSREGNYRSDTERANAERTLSFYEVLDERLDRVETELTKFHALHQMAVDQQHKDDDARQSDVPQSERRYVRMPQLRWVRRADQEIEGFEGRDDFDQLKRRARQYLDAVQSFGTNQN